MPGRGKLTVSQSRAEGAADTPPRCHLAALTRREGDYVDPFSSYQ
jgi:hypothetical protein